MNSHVIEVLLREVTCTGLFASLTTISWILTQEGITDLQLYYHLDFAECSAVRGYEFAGFK